MDIYLTIWMIFSSWEKTFTINLPNSHIFQTENTCSLKCRLHVIPYPACQLWKQVPIDISKAASLAFLKNRIKIWKCEDCLCRPYKTFKMSGISDYDPLVTDSNISVNCGICMKLLLLFSLFKFYLSRL